MKIAFFIRFASLAISFLSVTHGTPSSISAPPPLSTITIAGQIFVLNPANPILNSTTVRPGSAGISINGQIVSADAADDLYVDGTEILAGPTGATSAGSTITNRTASLSSSSGVTLSSSISASSGTATAAGLNVLAQAIDQMAAQVASNRSLHSRGDVTTSASASISMSALASDGTVSSGVATTSLASVMMSSSLSWTSPARATSSVPIDSQSQSFSTNSKAMTASTSKINLSLTGSSIHRNSSSGLFVVPVASQISQSVSSGANPLSSAGTSSQPATLVPGAQPNTITTGPTMAIPTNTLNPTGSVASSQGMLLVGAIFGITQEAKTLSAIVKDDGPKESFISKIKGTEDDILDLLEDIHPPGPPPSYQDACLDGVSILDIIKILGCLKSGFDEVTSDLDDEPPDVIKIQSMFDNFGKLAKNLEDEEEDDDDESSAVQTASATQDSATKGSSSTNTPSSITSSASSSVSSSSSTATEAMQPLETYLVGDPMPSDDNLGIADQVFMTFLGDILSSAMGIGSSPSGFAVITTATLNSTSSATIPSTPTIISPSSLSLSSAIAATSSNIPGGAVAQSTTTAISSPVSSSNSLAGNLASEIAHLAGQLASSQAPASTTMTTANADAASNAAAIIVGLASLVNQIESKSSLSLVTTTDNPPAPTSTPTSAPAPAPSQPAGPKYGIYLAFQVYTQGGANAWTDYYYKVWVTDLTANPGGPDFCAAKSWIANVQVNDNVDSVPPYPTKDFSFTIPEGETGPGSPAVPCVWEPSPGGSQPGSVSCNPGEVAICSVPPTTGIICKGDNQNRIEPLAQCVFG